MSQKSKFNKNNYKRLLGFGKPYIRLAVFGLFCTLCLSVLGALRPMFIGNAVQDNIISHQNPKGFLFWILLIFGMLLLEAVLQFFNAFLSNLFAQSVVRDIRIKVFNHFGSFRMKYFDKTPVGNLVTRVVSDIEAISEVFSSGLIDIIGDFLVLIFVLTMMIFVNWKLTLLALLPIPILIFATRIFAKAMKKSFQMESSAVASLNTFVQERLTGMNIVQLFGRQEAEMKSFVKANETHRNAHIKAVWAYSIFFPIVETLSSLSIAFMLVWGAFYISNDGKSNAEMFGQILSFTFWINMVYRPIRMLADKFNTLQRGVVRAERVFEVLDSEENIQNFGTKTDVAFNQPIVFKDISFAYSDENWVLKNIDLEIPANTTIAFVGATGAGKTSIVNLLSRFYEYQKGEINIGNVELREIELNTLRKNIAVVLQDVFLFSDSIHNNITLGNEAISREQVIVAAKEVGAHEFIMKLSDNYDHQVGERGGVLSVGQRQLLAFIRAYVYNPHILILDEATSSVDSESEEMIQKATEKLTKGRTSIVIAHRLSTIKMADKIIVLDQGEIKEMGSHSELLGQNGFYHKLYQMQFSKI